MQAYSDPEREEDTWSLPDVEVFHMSYQEFLSADEGSWMKDAMDNIIQDGFSNFQAASDLKGFYWWPCFPGCLPDGEPTGPFQTEQAALEDAQDI